MSGLLRVWLPWLPLPSRERAGVRVQRHINEEILNLPWLALRPTLIPRLLPEREKEPKPDRLKNNGGAFCRS